MLSSGCDWAFGCLKAKLVKHSCVIGLVLLENPTKLLSCEAVYKQNLSNLRKLIMEKWNLDIIVVNLGLKGERYEKI